MNLMDWDFTTKTYLALLKTFQSEGYCILSFDDYILHKNQTCDSLVILRHDVDKKPFNALRMAQVESSIGVFSTYYFRTTDDSNEIAIMSEIADLGHHIGYHYREFSSARGDFDEAIRQFKENLEKMRKQFTINTICMDGSPASQWDNRDLWGKFNYKDFGIIAEPYFDINYEEVLYLTDTGRCWNGEKYSVRDKVESGLIFNVHSTFDIIHALQNHLLPQKLMLNAHPQRWVNSPFFWLEEYIMQNIRNQIKKMFFVKMKII